MATRDDFNNEDAKQTRLNDLIVRIMQVKHRYDPTCDDLPALRMELKFAEQRVEDLTRLIKRLEGES